MIIYAWGRSILVLLIITLFRNCTYLHLMHMNTHGFTVSAITYQRCKNCHPVYMYMYLIFFFCTSILIFKNNRKNSPIFKAWASACYVISNIIMRCFPYTNIALMHFLVSCLYNYFSSCMILIGKDRLKSCTYVLIYVWYTMGFCPVNLQW